MLTRDGRTLRRHVFQHSDRFWGGCVRRLGTTRARREARDAPSRSNAAASARKCHQKLDSDSPVSILFVVTLIAKSSVKMDLAASCNDLTEYMTARQSKSTKDVLKDIGENSGLVKSSQSSCQSLLVLVCGVLPERSV
jgi:hypothetical protein